MIKEIITVLWFLVLTKTLFFWVWLWQLKEYHLGRFKAHFESQKTKKIISSFWRIKQPRITKKVLLILLFGSLFEILLTFYAFSFKGVAFYLFLLAILIFSPIIFSLIVLFFQIPTVMIQRIILKKAKKKREKFSDLLVIGITGSYGKTSTKEFLAQVLSKNFKVLKTEKHVNAEIGIAQTILKKLNKEHQIFIAEIGAYERGKIKQVCEMIKPKIGVLTGISEQHLSTFGSQENIIKGKFELIESLPESGVAVFNANNQIIMSAVKSKELDLKVKSKIFCSLEEKLDFWTDDIKVEKEKISFRVFSKDGDSSVFELNLIGVHNVEILLLVCAVAKSLGMSLSEISQIAQTLKPIKGALRLLKTKDGLNILDATYSANPHGVVSHLNHLKLWEGKKIVIMPSLIELGKESESIHKRIGEKIGEVCDLAIVTTKDGFKHLKEGVVKSGVKENQIIYNPDPEEIIKKIKEIVNPGDVILLESRVPQRLKKSLL